jgi:xanthine/uracil permease
MAEQRDAAEPFTLHREERPVGGLLSDLARQFTLLLRQEMALARAEIVDKIGQLGSASGLVAAGGLIAFAGFLYLLAAATLGLGKVVEMWLAALIVGAVVLLLGIGLALLGRARLQASNLVPLRTVRSLKDDAAWAKEQVQ